MPVYSAARPASAFASGQRSRDLAELVNLPGRQVGDALEASFAATGAERRRTRRQAPDWLVGDGAPHALGELGGAYAGTGWRTQLPADFGIPVFHPVFGDNGLAVQKNLTSAQVGRNVAVMTGLLYLSAGVPIEGRDGVFSARATGSDNPLPVIFVPRRSDPLENAAKGYPSGDAHGEPGPMYYGSHNGGSVWVFDGFNPEAHWGAGKSRGCFEIRGAVNDLGPGYPALGSDASKRGLVSDFHLDGLRIVGPGSSVGGNRPMTYGLVVTCESGMVSNVAVQRCGPIGSTRLASFTRPWCLPAPSPTTGPASWSSIVAAATPRACASATARGWIWTTPPILLAEPTVSSTSMC